MPVVGGESGTSAVTLVVEAHESELVLATAGGFQLKAKQRNLSVTRFVTMVDASQMEFATVQRGTQGGVAMVGKLPDTM